MRTRAGTRKSLAVATGVAATVAVLSMVGCSKDESDDTLVTSSTSSSTSEPTTTAAPTTASPESSTTAAPETTAAPATTEPGDLVVGKAVLTMGTGVTPMDIKSCSTTGESSINVVAEDEQGNEIDVRARNDVGVVTYRGPTESREGTTVRVTVGSDKGFNVLGGLNGAEFSLAGRCS